MKTKANDSGVAASSFSVPGAARLLATFGLAAAAAVAMSSCATRAGTGAAAGAGTGAVLAGPPGAVVGAGVGALGVTAVDERRARR